MIDVEPEINTYNTLRAVLMIEGLNDLSTRLILCLCTTILLFCLSNLLPSNMTKWSDNMYASKFLPFQPATCFSCKNTSQTPLLYTTLRLSRTTSNQPNKTKLYHRISSLCLSYTPLILSHRNTLFPADCLKLTPSEILSYLIPIVPIPARFIAMFYFLSHNNALQFAFLSLFTPPSLLA